MSLWPKLPKETNNDSQDVNDAKLLVEGSRVIYKKLFSNTNQQLRNEPCSSRAPSNKIDLLLKDRVAREAISGNILKKYFKSTSRKSKRETGSERQVGNTIRKAASRTLNSLLRRIEKWWR